MLADNRATRELYRNDDEKRNEGTWRPISARPINSKNISRFLPSFLLRSLPPPPFHLACQLEFIGRERARSFRGYIAFDIAGETPVSAALLDIRVKE